MAPYLTYRGSSTLLRANPPNLLLDRVDTTNLKAAVSFRRKLRKGYTGNAFQLQRASDNATLEVGFTTDDLVDQTAAIDFCSGTEGYVNIWYDQSGNSNDYNAAPATLTHRARVVNAGAFEEGRFGANAASYLTREDTYGLTGSPGLDTFMPLQRLGAVSGTFQGYWDIGDSTSPSMSAIGHALTDATPGITSWRFQGGSAVYVDSGLFGSMTTQWGRRGLNDQIQNSRMFLNNVERSINTTSNPTGVPNINTDRTTLGWFTQYLAGSYLNGLLPEAIIYANASGDGLSEGEAAFIHADQTAEYV